MFIGKWKVAPDLDFLGASTYIAQQEYGSLDQPRTFNKNVVERGNAVTHRTNLQLASKSDWSYWLNIQDPKLAVELTQYEIAFTTYLNESSNQRGMFKKVHSELGALGFSQFGFLLLRSKFDAEEFVWSYPDRDRSFYTVERLYEKDLMLDGILKDPDGISELTQSAVVGQLKSWKEHDDIYDGNIEIIENMARAKVHNYYDIGIPIDGGGKAILSVAAREASVKEICLLAEKHRAKLAIIAGAICHVGSTKYKVNFHHGNQVLQPGSLALQLLDTYANDDLHIYEIAEKHGISLSTAKKKLAEVRKALGTRTLPYAVTQAVLRGLVQFRR